jgi:hypothetical protein
MPRCAIFRRVRSDFTRLSQCAARCRTAATIVDRQSKMQKAKARTRLRFFEKLQRLG